MSAANFDAFIDRHREVKTARVQAVLNDLRDADPDMVQVENGIWMVRRADDEVLHIHEQLRRLDRLTDKTLQHSG